MHTLLFNPRPESLSWSSDVISEVNSKLNLDLAYLPADDSRLNREYIAARPQQRIYKPEKSLYTPCKQQQFYEHQQVSAYSLRLPDICKRVFAPPNCLTPEAPSPERKHYKDRAPQYIDPRQRAILSRAIFGPDVARDNRRVEQYPGTFVSTSILSPPRRPDVPWLSRDTLGRPSKTPTGHPRVWSGLFDWTSRSARTADSEYSVNVTAPLPKLAATTASIDRAAQMESDIQAFLDSVPPSIPLTAEEITSLCERGGGIISRSTSVTSPEASQASRFSKMFSPRQTIGKLSSRRSSRQY